MKQPRKGRLLTKKELKQLADRIKRSLWRRKHPLDGYWSIGRIFRTVIGPPYGKIMMRRITRSAGINPTTLYNCVRFYSRWPSRKQLEDLIAKDVLWSHVLSLLQRWLSDKDRETLVRYIAKHHPTCTAFRDKVRAKVRAKKINARKKGLKCP